MPPFITTSHWSEGQGEGEVGVVALMAQTPIRMNGAQTRSMGSVALAVDVDAAWAWGCDLG
jgi:hypothetical protein